MVLIQDYWPTEGSQHHSLSKEDIYIDGKINSFLDGDQYTLVVASKGMGKTLLLRAKKKLLEDAQAGVLIIPRNMEYDEPDLRGTLPAKGYSRIRFWEDIWTAAIVFSVLSYRWSDKEDLEESFGIIVQHIQGLDIDANFKNDLLSDIEFRAKNLPSYYLSMILDRSISSVDKFARSMRHVDELSRKFINSAVSVFIDAFDQTLTAHFSFDLDAWRAGQLGLAKAARKIHNMNHHIKVYASIRQEAWAGFDDDDREAIKGSTIILEYSEFELKKMFEHCVRVYSSYKSIEKFLGLCSVKNGWCRIDEEPFSYMYRHSAGTARSLMYIGGALNSLDLNCMDSDERERALRKCVNKVGSDNILEDYLLGQRKIFLNTLHDLNKILLLLKLIPSNVLTGNSLKSINHEFAAIVGLNESSSHPFCELYNVGLLGVVQRDHASNIYEQYFRKPYQFHWGQKNIVREDSIYLIHPGLLRAINEQRSDFHVNTVNVIGSGRLWRRINNVDGIPLLFLSHSTIDKPIVSKIFPIFEHYMNLTFPSHFWYDEWNIRAGEDIHQEIERGVEESDVVLVFVSKSSLLSGWVEKEWRRKHYDEINNKQIQVIPLIIDSTKPEDLPAFLRAKKAMIYHLSDIDDQKKNLRQLADDIAYHLEKRFVDNLDVVC